MWEVYEFLKFIVCYVNFIILVVLFFGQRHNQDDILELKRKLNILEMAEFARRKKNREREGEM